MEINQVNGKAPEGKPVRSVEIILHAITDGKVETFTHKGIGGIMFVYDGKMTRVAGFGDTNIDAIVRGLIEQGAAPEIIIASAFAEGMRKSINIK